MSWARAPGILVPQCARGQFTSVLDCCGESAAISLSCTVFQDFVCTDTVLLGLQELRRKEGFVLTQHRLRHKRYSGRLVDARDRVNSQGCLSYSIKHQVQNGSDLYCGVQNLIKQNALY